MKEENRSLPVLWHQSLLSFVQFYKNDLSPEARKDLLELIKIQDHYQISPEIRRELEHAGQKQAKPENTTNRNDGMEF